jgi:uncharacterized protein (TIGR03437 family)
VSVTAGPGCAWTAASNANWITLTSAAGGSGSGAVSYSVAANPGADPRTGTITIAGQTFTVTQGGACKYGISPANQSFPPTGGAGTMAVTASTACSWTASSPVSWVRITAGASGTANGTVSFSVASNNTTTTARSTTLTVAGQSFAISQTGAPGPIPAFAVNGVTNGASFAAGVTPGGIVTIFGVGLSKGVDGIVTADKLPLPTRLAGTSVTVSGAPAPLFAVANVKGSEQINLQIPYEVAGQKTATIVVSTEGGDSTVVQVDILAAHPGIFTVDGKAGAILHGAENTVVTPTAPAKRGEVVVIYGTGLGAVNPVPATGEGAPTAEPLARTPLDPTVTVGGASADILYSGLAPGFVGLYQVNIRIPATSTTGSAVPVIVTMAGAKSNTATAAVSTQ